MDDPLTIVKFKNPNFRRRPNLSRSLPAVTLRQEERGSALFVSLRAFGPVQLGRGVAVRLLFGCRSGLDELLHNAFGPAYTCGQQG